MDEHKQARVHLVWGIFSIGLMTSVVYHFVMTFYQVPNRIYPYTSFLYIPEQHFGDWPNTYNAGMGMLYLTSSMFAYFPFSGTVVRLLNWFAPGSINTMWLSLYLPILTSLFIVYYFLNKVPLLMRVFFAIFIGLFNYGLLFVIDRANLEGMLFFFLALFIICRYKNLKFLELLFLACAISLKGYPATLGLIYIHERRYKDLLTIGVLTFALSFYAINSYGATYAELWQGYQNSMAWFKEVVFFSYTGMQHSSSLWVAINIVKHHFNNTYYMGGNEHLIKTYYWIVAALCVGCVAFCHYFKKVESWKITSISIALLILIPPVSYDYKMVHMLIPVMLFIAYGKNRVSDWVLGICFTLLIIPKDFYFIVDYISISSFLNPLLMLIAIGAVTLPPIFQALSDAMGLVIESNKLSEVPS